jgi:hypothetical protein
MRSTIPSAAPDVAPPRGGTPDDKSASEDAKTPVGKGVAETQPFAPQAAISPVPDP